MIKLKILIAEDDENSQIFLKLAVKSFSKDIILANNRAEAVEACKNQPGIDLVLMDIKMPKMDSHEATRQIREFNKNLIIITQTAFAESGDKEKVMAQGFNDYIS